MAQTLQINGQARTVDVDDPDTPLLYVLRDNLGLRGPRFGCGLGQCGACTVHVDGSAVRSCVTPLSSVGTGHVVTLEGLSPQNGLHPLQQCWRRCGFVVFC